MFFARLLHSNFANVTEDCRQARSDLEASHQEVENLKRQLQEYVSEVRQVEELLAKKVCKMSGSAFTALDLFFMYALFKKEKK
jgi:hypothetical protein